MLVLLLVLSLFLGWACPSHAALPAEQQWRLALLDECVGAACAALQAIDYSTYTLCEVTTLNDTGTGSLRNCVTASPPRWIIFRVSGTLTLQAPLQMQSNTVVDGRAADITLMTGSSYCHEQLFNPPCDSAIFAIGRLVLNPGTISNVIVTHFKSRYTGGNTVVSIGLDTYEVWIDHMDIQGTQDEAMSVYPVVLSDPLPGPDNLVFSWNRWRQPDQSVPVPAYISPTDAACNFGGNHWCSKALIISGTSAHLANTYMTSHHNWWQTDIRNPSSNQGKWHSFNNYLDARFVQLGGQGPFTSLCGNPMVLSENDIYDHDTEYEPMLTGDANICGSNQGRVKAIGMWLINGAQVYQNNTSQVEDFHARYAYTAATADATLKAQIEAGAGWQAVNAPPYITITTNGGNGPGANFTTANASLSLGGTASDISGVGGSVSSITVTCSPSCGNPTESGTTTWSAPLTLSSGANLITATVTDNQGAQWQDTITVTLLASGAPTATITAPNSGNNTTVGTSPLTSLAGTASDDVSVTSVTVSCSPSCGSPTVTGTTSWSVASLPLTSGDNTITVTAHDGDLQTGQDSIVVTLSAVTVSAPIQLRFTGP